MVRPIRTLWFWNGVERGTEVITTTTPVNESKLWYLLGQILLTVTAEKRGQFVRKVRQSVLQK